ncbi:MAG: YihY/virulence factor BrkB family protein [Bacteroidota bacterium]
MKKIIEFVKELFAEFSRDDATTLAAALAYYTVFSIAPLLVIVISVSGFFLGADAVNGELYSQLEQLMGKDAALQIQETVKSAHVSGKSILATLISVGVLLFSATAVVGQLKHAINRAWNIAENPENGMGVYVKNRLLSLTFILGLGFIFLVSLALNSVAAFFSNELVQLFPSLNQTVTLIVPMIIAALITFSIFVLLFKYLPDAIIKWRDVFVGALFTTLLFLVGKYLIGFYIGNSDVASTFGSAGALASLMLWVYYNAIILLLGAEFTQIWSRRKASRIEPNKYAIRMNKSERHLQKAMEAEVSP